MSNSPDFDPFADDDKSEGGNQISVTFKAHGGYDAPWVVARGSADYLAGLMGLKDFDGKLSTLMQRVAFIDEKYKGWIGEPKGKG